jgi:hypothetical protein
VDLIGAISFFIMAVSNPVCSHYRNKPGERLQK